MLCMVLLLYDKLSLNHFKDVYDVIFFMAPFKGGFVRLQLETGTQG